MPARRSRQYTLSTIDKAYPFQIALPDDICCGHNFDLIRQFLEERGIDCQTRSVDVRWPCGRPDLWRLHCFALREHAEAFQAWSGGEWFDPRRDREGGRSAGKWFRQDAYRRILDSGPLSVPEILRT